MKHKKVTIRASGLGTFYSCVRKAAFQVEIEKEESSEALRVGSATHAVLLKKMSKGVSPYDSVREEDVQYLYTPAIFERYSFEKRGYFVKLSDITFPFVFKGETISSEREMLPKNILYYIKEEKVGRKKEKVNYYKFPEEVNFPGEWSEQTSIFDAVSSDMFSRELIAFEQRQTQVFDINGTEVTFTGQFDAIGQGILLDIKTTKKTPNKPEDDMHYIIQQAAYAYLNGLQNPMMVLLYIVKTKVPKLVPIIFKLGQTSFVKKIVEEYVEFLSNPNRKLYRSFGPHCSWCPYQEECRSEFNLGLVEVQPFEVYPFTL